MSVDSRDVAGGPRIGLNMEEVGGWVALIVTIIVWAGFSLSIRAISASALTPADVALMRFGIPSLLLLPWLPSRLKTLKAVPPKAALMIMAGAGLPFFLIAALGGKYTTAAHVSALIAGTLPLSLVFVKTIMLGRQVWRGQVASLAVIVLGVAFMVAGLEVQGAAIAEGIALLLVASILWAIFTIGLKEAQVDALSSVIILSVPSAILVALLMVSGVLDSHLGAVSAAQLLPFLVVQGFGVGIVSTLLYSVAVRRLGTHRCTAVGALKPVLTTFVAIPLLAEIPTWLTLVGVFVITGGIYLSQQARIED